MKSLAIATMLGALSVSGAHAFNLDFDAVEIGRGINPPLTLYVPGYGDVQFSAGFASALSVESYIEGVTPTNALSFQNGESVIVTFLGADPLNVDFDFVNLSSSESFNSLQLGVNTYAVGFSGAGGDAGINGVSFGAVPEPSCSMLAVTGACAVLLRRRRKTMDQ